MRQQLDEFLSYLGAERGAAKNTLLAYHQDIEHFFKILSQRNITQLSAVQEEDLYAFLSCLQTKGYASSSVYRAVMSLRTFFRFLRREKKIQEETTLYLDTPKIWQLIPEVLTIEEMEKLLAVANPDSLLGARDRAILELLYASGLRVSELCGLNIQDIDEKCVRVKGKGGKQRLVPVGAKALSAIDQYLLFLQQDKQELEALFLTKTGKRIARMGVWARVKFYAKKAGLQKRISPHTFRHSFATHLLENGADLRLIQEFLGHSRITTTERYTQISNKHVKDSFHAFHPRP